MNRKERKCTDILCLIVFIAYLGAMGFMTVYGFIKGDVDKLLAPLDGAGNFCGVTKGYKNYPYLYIANLMPTSTVNEVNSLF